MYRSFVRETNSMLNTRLKNQSLSTSQVSTQQNQPGSNYTTTEEAEVNPPAVPLTQDLGEAPPQVEPIQPQDSPILRQISILMEMIHMLQGQITTLTSQVNKLVCQAASNTVYNTVAETHISTTLASTLNEEEPVSEMTENKERDIEENYQSH